MKSVHEAIAVGILMGLLISSGWVMHGVDSNLVVGRQVTEGGKCFTYEPRVVDCPSSSGFGQICQPWKRG